MHAQVDPFLPNVNLLAPLRPQIFEHSCCEDPFTGGKTGADVFLRFSDMQNFLVVLRSLKHNSGKQVVRNASRSLLDPGMPLSPKLAVLRA